MADTPDEKLNKKSFDPRIQTEEIAFRRDEMNVCSKCGRMNPPTRAACMYCATTLAIKAGNDTAIKVTLRKLESWEPGHNVIVRAAAEKAEIAKAAAYLSIETADLRKLLDAHVPLPIARVEGEGIADRVLIALREFGIDCFVVGDSTLDTKHLPVRLSGIEMMSDGLSVVDFNTRSHISLSTSDVKLIVVGTVISSKIDTLEKKGRGRKRKLLDETSTGADESVIDIYDRRNTNGYRVQPSGFDFSCLGEDKGLIGSENMRRLIIALKEKFPSATLSADYMNVRHLLDDVWEIESRTDPQGLRRAGFGKVEFGSVASTSNLEQFTKYSRLQWHLS